MIYLARTYHDRSDYDELSIRWAQLMRVVADIDIPMGFDSIKPQEFGTLVYASAVLFPMDWYKDDTCKIQMSYCKGDGIPFFTSLEKLEQYMKDKNDGVLL